MVSDGNFTPFVSAASGLHGLESVADTTQSGTDNPAPVLALHGWLDNAESFRRLASELPDFSLKAPDLPGHGLSPWLAGEGSYLIWNSTQTLWRLLQETSAQMHLVGHSMGGAIGLCLAAAFPEKFLSFTMIDSAGPLSTEPEDVAHQLRKSVEAEARENRIFTEPGQAVAARQVASPKMTSDDLRAMVQRSLRDVAQGWQWRWDPALRLPSSLRLTEAQIAGLFRSLRCPVLAIRAQEGLMPENWFRQRVAQAPQLTVHELPGHHHLHMSPDTAPAVAQTFREFVRCL